MLTKEECSASLAGLYAMAQITVRNSEELKFEIGNDFEVLTKLINEHFDNPPLKFKELKEGMWVWDNKSKEYLRCYPYASCCWDKFVCYFGEPRDGDFVSLKNLEFEENRFYRKQVQEDE